MAAWRVAVVGAKPARDADPTERSAADTAAPAACSEVIAAPAEVQLLTESSEVRERPAELTNST
ncbi:hypothetical protein [Streptomyces peucetius]